MTRKFFWNWVRETRRRDSLASDRLTVTSTGEKFPMRDVWSATEVTPKVFKDELKWWRWDITLWINRSVPVMFCCCTNLQHA